MQMLALAATALLLAAAGLGCPTVGKEVVLSHPETQPMPEVAQPASLKIVTFNIYFRPWDRLERLRRAREVILGLDADVVALEEVSEGWFAGRDAKQMLATLPYPHHAYFMLERWGPFFENGLYLLSRYPIEDARGVVYPVNRLCNRKGMLIASIDGPGVKLEVVTLHQAATRRTSITLPQADTAAANLCPAREGELLIVLGDFNAVLDDEPVKRMSAAGDLVPAEPGPGAAPSSTTYGKRCADGGERIDHILVSRPGPAQPWHVASEGVVQPEAPFPSDHCPVWAILSTDGSEGAKENPEQPAH
jgi:endonuclease/exonuclease/phosphatase family metal-dependent hydrolase